jgi:hypothetical protein
MCVGWAESASENAWTTKAADWVEASWGAGGRPPHALTMIAEQTPIRCQLVRSRDIMRESIGRLTTGVQLRGPERREDHVSCNDPVGQCPLSSPICSNPTRRH